MHMKQLSIVASELRKVIGNNGRNIVKTGAALTASRSEVVQAYSRARYIAEHHCARADERAAFLRACGLESEAREAQMNLPHEL